jgi:hypothetical protein
LSKLVGARTGSNVFEEFGDFESVGEGDGVGVAVAVGVGEALTDGIGVGLGVGVTEGFGAAITVTPLLQTNFFPDLRQVYVLP